MEIAVMVISKTDPNDAINDAGMPKAGDSVVWKPDGSHWGIDEFMHPFWHLLRVTGLTDLQGDALCAPELPVDPQNPSPVLQYRGMGIDVNALDALCNGAFLAPKVPPLYTLTSDSTSDDVRAALDATPTIDGAAFFALAFVKPALPIP